MTTPTKPGRKRANAMSYWVSRAEHAALTRAAEQYGATVSTMVRVRCLEETPPAEAPASVPDQPRTYRKNQIWVTPQERDMIQLNARAAGYDNTSDWLRQKALSR